MCVPTSGAAGLTKLRVILAKMSRGRRGAGARRPPPSLPPPEPRSERPRGELALVLGRFFSLELIAAAIRAAQETGLGGFSSLQEQSGKSQILSEKQALAFSQGPF